MSELKILGSDSSGNCMILSDGSQYAVIDAGVKTAKVLKAVRYDITRVSCLMRSHRHGDHSAYFTEYLKTFAPTAYLEKEPEHLYTKNVSNFSVKLFELSHDVPTRGFLISNLRLGNIFYATDTRYYPSVPSSVNWIILEANYSESLLQSNESSGKIPGFLAERIRYNHASLENAIDFLKKAPLSNVSGIILAHISEVNGAPESFKSSVMQITGVPTYCAYPQTRIKI